MHCVGGRSRKYALNKLALPSLWPMHERTILTQIEVMAFEEASVLLQRNQDVPSLIQLGMTYLHLWSSLPNVPFKISLMMVIMPLFISRWIQMLNQNQGMGRIFIISTLSNYPFCKKTNERWMNSWATPLIPSNIPLLRYSWIYHLLSGPP
jgi:hypothetical protein